MHRELLRVERVDPCKTVNPSVTSWTITGETVELHPRTLQFQTINPWHATNCTRGLEIGRHVWIWWRSSQFGTKDILNSELDNSKWVHEGAAS